ncbi:probable cardiolipin synthase (CMP-forming) [Argiope bruennichi]|nr:probable cardiolipin synthase (CMP-forming) [Argiope bruennichi]
MASLNFCIRNCFSLKRNFQQNFINVKKLKAFLCQPITINTGIYNTMSISCGPGWNYILSSKKVHKCTGIQYFNASCMSRWTNDNSRNLTNDNARKKQRNMEVRFAENMKVKIQSAKRETRRKVHKKISEIKENVLTIPNALCAIRIASTPVIGYLVLSELYTVSLGLVIFAGFTDVVDGFIARNFQNQQSMIGSFLDPAADKLLIATLFVTLTINGLIPIPLTSLILFRDACLFGAGFYIRYVSLPPPKTLSRYFDMSLITAKLSPTGISKMNTMIQLTLVSASLAAPVFNYVDHMYLHILWYITATTTVLSAASYLYYNNSTYKLFTGSDRDKE